MINGFEIKGLKGYFLGYRGDIDGFEATLNPFIDITPQGYCSLNIV